MLIRLVMWLVSFGTLVSLTGDAGVLDENP